MYDEGADDETAKVRLTEGKFTGIVYHYNTITFHEAVEDDEDSILNFNYEIDDLPEGFDVTAMTDEDKEEFERTLADVLDAIIHETLKEPE